MYKILGEDKVMVDRLNAEVRVGVDFGVFLWGWPIGMSATRGVMGRGHAGTGGCLRCAVTSANFLTTHREQPLHVHHPAPAPAPAG